MTLRARLAWILPIMLAIPLSASAKPTAATLRPAVDGTATPILTQDYYETETPPGRPLTDAPARPAPSRFDPPSAEDLLAYLEAMLPIRWR